MADPIILWEEVDKLLPLAQDPDCRQCRKDLFKRLLGKGHKTLTIEDCQKGIKLELRHDMAGSYVPGVKEMTKTIKLAFKCACDMAPPGSPTKSPSGKKKLNESAKVDTGVAHAKSAAGGKNKNADVKGKSVDKREFHAFLLALRYYLEIDEVFELSDGACDDDQKLSCREALKGKDKLAEWGIPEDVIREKFQGVDLWVAHMKFDDYVDWVMSVRMESIVLKLDDSDDEEVQFGHATTEFKNAVDVTFKDLGAESDLNKMKVKESFDEWDADKSGGISSEEMAAVMIKLNPSFTEAKVKMLFDAADVNKDGLIDFDEFLAFVFK